MKQDWRPPVELPHPSYPHQRHNPVVYDVGDGGMPVRFAAGVRPIAIRVMNPPHEPPDHWPIF
ncbi:hypothetical protein [Sphingopyxis sp. H050]|jgi:hypothetical protein|uniref:hypothetical protein n=1 Tax=Sphingopyxis sp. H050 TaxID=1759072 RepID=UPI0012E35DF4|nr:hypothetical protein [Sphingopyxis sp. H050]